MPDDAGAPQHASTQVPTDASTSTSHEQASAAREERYGPLLLERHVKDDGRGLILFRVPVGAARDRERT